MSDNRALYTEEAIIGAVKRLLAGRVNEILGEVEFSVPHIEFGGYSGGDVVVPAISLATCERSEKERVVRLDAYTLTICFTLPDAPESELRCYAVAAAVETAVSENPTFGGTASRVVLTAKKYTPPKKAHCGDGWEIALTLRVTAENPHPCGFSA